MPAQWTGDIVGQMHLSHITKRELADCLGVTPEYVSMVLHGHRKPSNAESRFRAALAYLIEKYTGAFPLWLAPEQVRIMTITNRADDYAYQLKDRLEKEGMRVSVDDRNEKIGFKVREAQTQKIPYMLVLGDQEVENGTAALRSRKNENFGAMPVADIIAKLREEIDSKAR